LQVRRTPASLGTGAEPPQAYLRHDQRRARQDDGSLMKLSDVVALSQLGAEPLETEAIVAAAAATTYNTYGYDFDVPVEDRVSEVREGARFRIPLVLPEEAFTGDNRKFKNGVVEIRELPLPLVWQVFSDSGHAGSVIVGRIDHMERIDGGIGNAYGVFDTGPY